MTSSKIQDLKQGKFFFHEDIRGFWARTFEAELFRTFDISAAQSSISFSKDQGTLRGLHLMAPGLKEWKVITVVQGSVWDVVVDLRPSSPTFKQWQSFRLEGGEGKFIGVPPGCAHGYFTLSDNVVMAYTMSTPYKKEFDFGVNWDDEELAIKWPGTPRIVSARDQSLPKLQEFLSCAY